jgi:hypothetical protein
MSRPKLNELSAQAQAEASAQLARTPKPRTVQLVHAEPLRFEPNVKPVKPAKPTKKTPLAVVVAFFASHGVPAPEAEFKFAPDRKWRFDFCWSPQRIALEVDGGIWVGGRHTRGSGFAKDMEK